MLKIVISDDIVCKSNVKSSELAKSNWMIYNFLWERLYKTHPKLPWTNCNININKLFIPSSFHLGFISLFFFLMYIEANRPSYACVFLSHNSFYITLGYSKNKTWLRMSPTSWLGNFSKVSVRKTVRLKNWQNAVFHERCSGVWAPKQWYLYC